MQFFPATFFKQRNQFIPLCPTCSSFRQENIRDRNEGSVFWSTETKPLACLNECRITPIKQKLRCVNTTRKQKDGANEHMIRRKLEFSWLDTNWFHWQKVFYVLTYAYTRRNQEDLIKTSIGKHTERELSVSLTQILYSVLH